MTSLLLLKKLSLAQNPVSYKKNQSVYVYRVETKKYKVRIWKRSVVHVCTLPAVRIRGSVEVLDVLKVSSFQIDGTFRSQKSSAGDLEAWKGSWISWINLLCAYPLSTFYLIDVHGVRHVQRFQPCVGHSEPSDLCNVCSPRSPLLLFWLCCARDCLCTVGSI